MDGVVIPVARMIVELEHNYNTDIVTILLPQEEEINDLEMHRKQETVILREVMVCIWHFIFRLKGALYIFFAPSGFLLIVSVNFFQEFRIVLFDARDFIQLTNSLGPSDSTIWRFRYLSIVVIVETV